PPDEELPPEEELPDDEPLPDEPLLDVPLPPTVLVLPVEVAVLLAEDGSEPPHAVSNRHVAARQAGRNLA
ncbi:MAG: hypothetical protein WAM52_15440, partial [Steroidobacteraceae bacterium]